MKLEVACTECMWVDEVEEYVPTHCPNCDAEVEVVENQHIWEYFNEFNWNKK